MFMATASCTGTSAAEEAGRLVTLSTKGKTKTARENEFGNHFSIKSAINSKDENKLSKQTDDFQIKDRPSTSPSLLWAQQ
jgi:hypothetical protein